jgi:allantoicase
VDVDTSHFTGNFPSHCSLECCTAPDGNWAQARWSLALPQVRLQGGAHNIFDIADAPRCTHVRLNIFPDGGVARLRVYGEVIPDLDALARSPEPADFASVTNGGLVLACSDMYFGSKNNLIMPGKPANMGGGWETRRRRGPGHDWIIVRLGARCHFERVTIATEHYKGNYPDRCSVDACYAESPLVEDLLMGKVGWQEILVPQKLNPDAIHQFQSELTNRGPFTHARLNIYPDGGISRLRVYGRISR